MKYYMGLDPGKKGWAVVIDGKGAVVETLAFSKSTEQDIADFIYSYSHEHSPILNTKCVLERVHAIFVASKGTMFTLGYGYGMLSGILTTCHIVFDRALAKKWQAYMSCLTKGDKHVSKQRAEELFPQEKITLENADAYIIAEYCRRKENDREGK